MNLYYYTNTIKGKATTPKEYFLKQKQAQIDALWEISTQNKEVVLMQEDIGSSNYIEVPVSVDSAIDLSTGFKKGDDYKIFSHKDISLNHAIGLMYQYANNYWITIDNSDLASAVSSIEVRRCNNTLRWIDKSTGALNEIPCIIDYELSSPSPQRDKDIIVANGHIVVICQSNTLTEAIEKNQRFIFEGQPFKLSAINNLAHDDIETDLTPLMYLDLYLDIIEPDDDIANNIANKGEYDYQIKITNAPTQQINGFESQLFADVYCNNVKVDSNIKWEANQFATVNNNGTFSLNGDVGSIATITATMVDNQSVKTNVDIAIVDDIEDYYDITMSPDITEIRQRQSIPFELKLYKNGVEVANIVTASVVRGAKYVSLTPNAKQNSYTLTCQGLSSNNVMLELNSEEYTITKEIKLKPYF